MIERDITDGRPVLRAHSETLNYQTAYAPQFVDITEDVAAAVSRARVSNGLVLVYSRHTAAANTHDAHREPQQRQQCEPVPIENLRSQDQHQDRRAKKDGERKRGLLNDSYEQSALRCRSDHRSHLAAG